MTEQQTENNKKKRVQPTKVQAVLTPELRDKLDKYKETQKYKNDGEALRAILSAFFNGEADISGDTIERLEQRIASLEKALYHNDMDIPKLAVKAYENYLGLNNSLNRVINVQSEQNTQIRELEEQIQEFKQFSRNNSTVISDHNILLALLGVLLYFKEDTKKTPLWYLQGNKKRGKYDQD